LLRRFFYAVTGALVAGAAFQIVGAYRDRRRFPPPGRLIPVSGQLLHLHEQGSGKPIVVLEAGIAGSSIGWALVQPEIAKFTTVCSYDRAGLGWSSRLSGPPSVRRMSQDLETLLRFSGLQGPFVLAGHSFGGLLASAFAHRYPGMVSALLLLDPASAQSWSNSSGRDRERLAAGASLSRRGALLARLGLVRLALVLFVRGKKSISKWIGRTAAGKGSSTLERLVGEVGKLPPAVWPQLRAHWSHPKAFLAMAAYLEALPACASDALTMTPPPNIPVTVLSAETATPSEISERNRLIEGNPRGRHIVVEGGGHWLQLERPQMVVSAVRELVESGE
jgi:pimeloyl-ACP methyl ester carboxylesterase